MRALPLAHEVGKVLRQRDGLGDVGRLCAQLGPVAALPPRRAALPAV